jgi:fermentation-respiration switch protein FrsA (DUF1100 family)
MIAVVIAAAAALGAIALLGLRAFSRHLIYLPWRWSESQARAWNPGYEEVWVDVPGGVRLHGWLARGSRRDLAVLICHGNAGNLGVQEGLFAPYRRLGVTALLFDYRGYGLSTGRPDEEGIAADTLAALDSLARLTDLPPERLVLHGKSLGGAPAARAAAGRRVAGLILESAFTSAVDLGRDHYPFLPVSRLMKDSLDALSRLGQITCPVLILHGERDGIVPPAHAPRLAAAAGERATLVLLPRSGHNDTFEAEPAAYLGAVRQFLDRVAPPPGPSQPRLPGG